MEHLSIVSAILDAKGSHLDQLFCYLISETILGFETVNENQLLMMKEE